MIFFWKIGNGLLLKKSRLPSSSIMSFASGCPLYFCKYRAGLVVYNDDNYVYAARLEDDPGMTAEEEKEGMEKKENKENKIEEETKVEKEKETVEVEERKVEEKEAVKVEERQVEAGETEEEGTVEVDGGSGSLPDGRGKQQQQQQQQQQPQGATAKDAIVDQQAPMIEGPATAQHEEVLEEKAALPAVGDETVMQSIPSDQTAETIAENMVE